jgi:porin
MSGAGMSSARYGWMVLLGLALPLAPNPASAQPVDIPLTWGGDFLTRPRLTGSWDGLRDELGKKGVVLDIDTLLTPQGVVSGGRSTGAQFWGNAEYTLNADTGKMGLWPGGFLKIYALSGFGSSVLGDSGGIVPVNTGALVPRVGDPATGLMNATFLQFLSPKFGLIAGKLDMLDIAQDGEFTGNYRTQFMNAAFSFPMTSGLIPLSAFGGGVIALPWEGVQLSVLALDPNGTVTSNDLGHAFQNGATFFGGGQVTIKPFNRLGHQGLSAMGSTQNRFSLTQDPSNLARILLNERFPRLNDPGPILGDILGRFFPQLLVPTQPLNRSSDSWGVFYNFDQYFWHPGGDQKRGIGTFFQFGVSDGQTNPIKYSYTVGISGKGVVPGRPLDTFGAGWARTEFSDKFAAFLRQQLNLGLGHEDVFEAYYNASVTQWLNATLDLQVVDPGLNKVLDSSRQLTNVDTAVVVGARLYTRF